MAHQQLLQTGLVPILTASVATLPQCSALIIKIIMLFRVCQHFSRSTRDILRISQLRERRQGILELKSEKYKSPVMFMHKDNIRIEYFYGKNNFLSAVTRNTVESSQFTIQTLKQIDPDLLILGGLDNNELDTYMGRDLRVIDDSTQLFCKHDLSLFAQKTEAFSKTMVFHEQSKMMFMINDDSKSIHTHDYLTAGLNALGMDTCQVMFGQPSSILVVQDLILRYTLQQLQQLFNQLVNHIKRIYKCETISHSNFIKIWLHDMSENMFKHSIYGKLNSYMAAIFKKACRNNKKCLMFLSRHFIDIVAHDSVRDAGQPDNLYRGYLKQTDHHEKELYQRAMKQFTVQEILKKFAILSVMINPQLTQYIWEEKQFFSHTIFRHLFKQISLQNIKNVFISSSDKYRQRLYEIQNQFIENNLYVRSPSLPQRLLLSEQKQQNDKDQEKYPLAFDVNNEQYELQQERYMEVTHSMMLDTLKKQRRNRETQLLEQFFSGQYSKQNIVLYSKLFGETIIRHNIPFRLPIHHFEAFRGYYKNVMKRKILNDKHQHEIDEGKYLGEKEDMEVQRVLQQVNSKDFKPTEFLDKLKRQGVDVLQGQLPEGMTRVRRDATDEEIRKLESMAGRKQTKRGSKIK